MQHADIEFIRFSSADVIATSGIPNLWASGNLLHGIQDTFIDGIFYGHYTALLNGTTPPETDTLYRIIPESSAIQLREQKEYYTMALQGTTEGTVHEEDMVLDEEPLHPPVQTILMYLVTYGHLFDQ